MCIFYNNVKYNSINISYFIAKVQPLTGLQMSVSSQQILKKEKFF